jgi:hypothetical protein
MSPSVIVPNLTEIFKAFKLSETETEEYVCFSWFFMDFKADRECVRTGAAGARTRRSSGHHLWHPQNFDRFHYCFSLFESLVKEAKEIYRRIFLVDVIEEKTISGKENLSSTCLFALNSFYSQGNHQLKVGLKLIRS